MLRCGKEKMNLDRSLFRCCLQARHFASSEVDDNL